MFEEERKRVSLKLDKEREEGDLTFCVVTDSHLDDYEDDTIENIKAVDSTAHFDFIVHLGDIVNGNLPRNYTMKIMKEEMKKYKNAIESKVFFPVQGNHDGYCNVTDVCTAPDIALEKDWYDVTSFTNEYENVIRREDDPWFYADYKEKRLRLIVLSSFSYEWTQKGEFRKVYALAPRQLEWLEKEALNLEEGWTVMLFSHDGPLRYYNQERYKEEPWNGNSKELMEAVLKAKRDRKIDVAAWFIGHWHGDLCNVVEKIPFVIVGSQTCYIPQLWLMPSTGDYEDRKRESVTQDLWDAVVWKSKEKKLHLIRFGAGKDKIVDYD